MKRSSVAILVCLAVALFVGLIYAVLVAARVADPAPVSVSGVTVRRLWATLTAVVAAGGVIVGWSAMRRAARDATPRRPHEQVRANIALVTGLIALGSGTANLAVATGGPGTGNGVVGAAGAVVLGLSAAVLGGMARARAHQRHHRQPL